MQKHNDDDDDENDENDGEDEDVDVRNKIKRANLQSRGGRTSAI